MGNINSVTDATVVQGIGVLSINSPPVNALSLAVREGLYLGLPKLLADHAVQAVVLICEGRTFFAGADITEFGKPDTGPDFHMVTTAMENATKPVIAAIHGTALGGGLEVALTCHYRLAVPSAKLGLPEVNLGLLPGAGGTQRLPRLVGVEAALDFIALGKPVGAAEALKLGLIDALVDEGKLHEQALTYARQLVSEGRPLKRIRDLDDKVASARGKPEIFARFRERHARAFRGFKAPEKIVQAIEAAVELPFEEGLKQEQKFFRELMTSTESAAQRYAFFAEREAAKIPDVPSTTPTLPVRTVGVVGAGTMGGGIAMNFLNVGVPVVLVEIRQDALDRGIATMRKNYEQSARRGKLTTADVDQRLALLKPTLDFKALAECDLVIEAVYENLKIKQDVLRRLDAVVKVDAVLASNTSFLDLNALAAVTSRPQNVIGLHFFSPANVMRLLEVVRGARTSKEVIATAMQLGRKIGKVAVLAQVCPGFIANRMMRLRGAVADELILEGPMPWDIDRVLTDFGFPMGTFAMRDLTGLDVVGWDATNTSSSTVQEVLCEQGRWGQKRNCGYYDYDAQRNATPSPVVEKIIREFAARKEIAPRRFTDAELLERLLYPVINEGAKILEEGIAIRASDIDVALITGYGWPVFTGGPMFWAGTVGLPRICERLNVLRTERGDSFKLAALLEQFALVGKSFV